jgi:excisionase family DNA binding protein
LSLLTVQNAAEQLGTSPRVIRRLIAERRGRHVRDDSGDIVSFIAAARLEAQKPFKAS